MSLKFPVFKHVAYQFAEISLDATPYRAVQFYHTN